MPAPQSIQKGVNRQASQTLRGNAPQKFDKVRQRHLYSSFLFAPGMNGVITAGEYDLFTTIKGTPGQGYVQSLTDLETNWPEAGKVAGDHNLLIEAIGVDICRGPTDINVYPAAVRPATPGQAVTGFVDTTVPPHAVDVTNAATRMVLQYKTVSTAVPIGLLSDFPYPGGVVGDNLAARQIPAAAGASPAFSTTPAGAFNRAYMPVTRNACNPAFERRLAIALMLAAGETFTMSLKVPVPFTLLDVGQTAATGESNDASGCFVVRVNLFCTESFINRG